jgi:hypothetical protein
MRCGIKRLQDNFIIYEYTLGYNDGVVTYVKGIQSFLKVLQYIWKVF